MTGIGPTTKGRMQPINTLPVFKDAMRVWILEALSVLEELQWALANDHPFDEDRSEEIAGFYLYQVDDHWLLETQLEYWQHRPLSLADADDVCRLIDNARSLLILNEAIVNAIADLVVRDRSALELVLLEFGLADDTLQCGTHRRE